MCARHKLVDRGIIRSHWDDRRYALLNTYHHGDFHRRFLYRLHDTTSEPRFSNGRILFDVALAPQASWHASADHVPIFGGDVAIPVNELEQPVGISAVHAGDAGAVEVVTANCTTDNVHFNQSYDQSIDDMGALRIYDQDFSEDAWIPAAGVPWYVTIFGRDSLIASLQTMMIHHPFALGSLERLAEHQATEIDDWRDAEPGKMPHEIRFGELAHFHKIPHTPYYGTADATPLYLITLHETYLWTGNVGLLDRYRDVAERCLQWIDQLWRSGRRRLSGVQDALHARLPQHGLERCRQRRRLAGWLAGRSADWHLRVARLRLRREAADGRGVYRARRA